MADSQREYLQGVIEFYRTRTETKMTFAGRYLSGAGAVKPVGLFQLVTRTLPVRRSTMKVRWG